MYLAGDFIQMSKARVMVGYIYIRVYDIDQKICFNFDSLDVETQNTPAVVPAIIDGSDDSEIVFGVGVTYIDIVIEFDPEDNLCELPADGPETFEVIISQAGHACQLGATTAEVCILPDDGNYNLLQRAVYQNIKRIKQKEEKTDAHILALGPRCSYRVS